MPALSRFFAKRRRLALDTRNVSTRRELQFPPLNCWPTISCNYDQSSGRVVGNILRSPFRGCLRIIFSPGGMARWIWLVSAAFASAGSHLLFRIWLSEPHLCSHHTAADGARDEIDHRFNLANSRGCDDANLLLPRCLAKTFAASFPNTGGRESS
jgi:hypothetical protein